MGFLNPGKKPKRIRAADSKSKKPQKTKSIKLELPKPNCDDIPTTSIIEEQEDEEDKINSILERLPTEIIHEIFLMDSLTTLPFVCKSLHAQLKPTRSLKISLLKNFIVDLNSGIVTGKEYSERFALNKELLNFKFVTYNILKEVHFDTILSTATIASETKNRLILYYDKLNRKLLETMRRAEYTEEETNRELAEMADNAFNNIAAQDEELEDAPEQESQDFPPRFYRGPFDLERLQMIKLLSSKGLKYIDSYSILSEAMKAANEVFVLDELMTCCKDEYIQSVHPLITAFEQGRMPYVDWVVANLEDEQLLNHDDLWVYIYQKQNSNYLHYLENRGATPSHDVLGMLSSTHI